MNQQKWNNWSGFQQSQPEHILKPSSIDELKNIVQNHHKIRVVGAGHSFTPLVCTDATLLSLDHFSGVENVNTALTQANIWSGTRLFNLDQYLEPIQQSLMQQGILINKAWQGQYRLEHTEQV